MFTASFLFLVTKFNYFKPNNIRQGIAVLAASFGLAYLDYLMFGSVAEHSYHHSVFD